ncbi:hypothetical protein IAD21_04153 [Abditibacteriota bacterium]|nr:hypothetical protein IAD21_04153 [Abditibacteriota bacterium]
MESLDRRLPVYLLLDCSESMVGEGIEGVNAGMRQLLLDLHSDPHALETVWISIITFAGEARQILPLSEMIGIRAPHLKVQPGTSLGAALRLLRDCIANEVRPHSAQAKGDWKPLVFLLTDGEPTDEWREEARKLKEPTASGGKRLNIIAIGCGEDANPLVLNEIGDSVLMMGEGELDFRAAFQWISSSLSVSSQQLATPSSAGGLSLAKMPEGVFSAPLIPTGAVERLQPRTPSQLFLALRCSQTSKPYLTRYGFESEYNVYFARRTHSVDEDYFSGPRPNEDATMGVSSDRVVGVLPCPYCDNRAAGQCPNCKGLFCAPEDGADLQCPHCESVLSSGPGSGDPFSLSGRVG